MLVFSDFLKLLIFYGVTLWLVSNKNYKILKKYNGYFFILSGFCLLSLVGSIEMLSSHFSFFLIRNIYLFISMGYVVSISIILFGIIVFINSFKHLHNIEEEYKQLSFKLNSVFDSSTNCITLTKADGTIEMCNKKVIQKFSVLEQSLIGIKFWDIPCFQQKKEYQEKIKTLFFSMTNYNQKADKFYLLDNQDNSIILKIIFTPIINEKGHLIYVLIEGIDITALEKSFEELSQIQKMETIGIMAGGIAHDLNNTLSGITGSLSILNMLCEENKTVSIKDIKEYVEIMNHSTDRMTYLIKQFLSLSQKRKIVLETISLKEIIANIYKIGKNNFDKSIHFELDLPEEDCFIKGDSNLLEQALLNICMNSVQSMTTMKKNKLEWGGMLKISIYKKTFLDDKIAPLPNLKSGTYWIIEIEDTGIGMSQEVKSKIFTPFFTTKKELQGLGLGLTMVHKTIIQFKGAVSVYSEQGIGTIFHIYFPAVYPAIRRSEAIKPDSIVTGKGTILLVDDEDVILKIGKTILKKSGYSVLTAKDGEEAIKIYKEKKDIIDVVILDMIMPNISGLVVFEILTSLNPDVKVIFSSGLENDKRIKTVIESGTYKFLKKPFSAFPLTSLVKAVLDEK